MSETFLYKKFPFKKGNLNIWLAYPGIYSFGMSSLGFLTVFENYDKDENINAERIFVDTKITAINISDLDIFGFSFSFELDFLTIFKILKKYNIPLKASERDDSYPLICGGGPVLSANPEPFAELFDYIEIGDAENKSKIITETVRLNKDKSKTEILQKLSEIDGVYVPSFTRFDNKKGMLDLNGNPVSVTKTTLPELKCTTTPILSEKSFFTNTFIIEIARGCPQRCGFCNSSYLNMPYRTCDYDTIISKIETALKHTDKIAFLGSAIAAHPDFEKLCDYMYQKKDKHPSLELSVSSLRADGVSEKVAQTLVKCSQRHATIAIEAASEKLRKKINKNLSDKTILNTVKTLADAGFKGVKIYAMTGLPGESFEDIKAFVELSRKLKQIKKGFEIDFGFSTFVPKAHTPFQYSEREADRLLEEKYDFLKKELHKLGVKMSASSIKWDFIQALFSRGGRELFDFALSVFEKGGNLGAFKTSVKEFEKSGIIKNFDDIALSSRSLNTILPYEFIKFPMTPVDLKSEYNRLIN